MSSQGSAMLLHAPGKQDKHSPLEPVLQRHPFPHPFSSLPSRSELRFYSRHPQRSHIVNISPSLAPPGVSSDTSARQNIQVWSAGTSRGAPPICGSAELSQRFVAVLTRRECADPGNVSCVERSEVRMARPMRTCLGRAHVPRRSKSTHVGRWLS